MARFKNIKLDPLPVFIFVLAFVLRLLLSSFGTLSLDFNTFVAWSQQLATDGFGEFYNSWSDYLPGYLYILWFLGKAYIIFPQLPPILLYKLPAILFDIGTGLLIFLATSRFQKKYALVFTALYLFNPAVLANSALWGQIDGITSFFSLASVFFARTNPLLSSVALGVGALVKPQVGFIAPLVAFLWYRKFGLNKSIRYGLSSFVLFLVGFIPFSLGNSFLHFVFERLLTTANQYPYTSVNAFNFWTLSPGWWKPDGWLQILGVLMVVIAAVVVLLHAYKNQQRLRWNVHPFLLAAIIFSLSFLFLTRMHERHLLPALAPLSIAVTYYPTLWIPYALFSLTYIANLRYSFVWITENFRSIFSQEAIILFTLLNLVAAGVILLVLFRPKFGRLFPLRSLLTSTRTKMEIATIPFIEKNISRFLVAILGFTIVSRLIGLWHPPTFYFDEVYHAWTSSEMLRGNPAAWEWWNTPPQGFAYEWTHPPLAKLLMAGSMMILGENPLGWRLPSTLLGVGVVYLVYLLGFQLFKSKTIGILASAVFALDGLPLVMSRIGMNDTYFLFFALGAILFFLKEKYFWSAIFLGLAGASKWTTLWVVPILFVVMVLFGKKPRWSIFWFVFIPPLVYLASYIPFFASSHTFLQFTELQKQMWWYHTNLEATHTYQSSWWSWPLMVRPVWLFNQLKDDLVSNIYAIGNPFVFWIGLMAVVTTLFKGLITRQRVLLFVVASWALLFLPWALSPRIMFLYHYLPAIPFLSLATGWFLARQKKSVIIVCYLLFAICYLLFYPHWTGIFVPQWLDSLYYWLLSWK